MHQSQIDHRPYPALTTAWRLTQTWHDVLFAHWSVPFEQLRSVVPQPLPLDSYEGKYWVSVVAFGIQNFRSRWMLPIPKFSTFPEINFRTYITMDDKPGVYFLSLDVRSLPSVLGGRWFYHLPYFRAQMTLSKIGQKVHFASQRRSKDHPAIFDAEYMPTGAGKSPEPESLEYWLTERYCLYSLGRKGSVYRGEIHHPAWDLQPVDAMISQNTLTLASGIPLAEDAQPLLHYSPRQVALFWYPTRV